MSIPIENIYYLLCYAWDKLEEKDRVQIDVEASTTIQDLLARVLINASRILLKRGIDKTYLRYTEDRYGVKGKIDISDTLKRQLLSYQKTVCTYDEFSSDTLPNQILVTTLYRLARVPEIDRHLKQEMVAILRMLPMIQVVEITEGMFQQVRLHRNNHFYRFVLNVCRIVFDYTLPSEHSGEYHFLDFSRDEKKMNQLFEAFVRNFYRREQVRFPVVRREVINWQFATADKPSHKYLPRMETDITLENDGSKVIVDAKYYQQTMTTNYDKERIHSSNLYQLFSYLLNQHSSDPRTQTATGILLYPTVEEDYDLSYSYQDHTIEVRTVNLGTSWQEIAGRLLRIVGAEGKANSVGRN